MTGPDEPDAAPGRAVEGAPRTRWSELTGHATGADYAARFAALAQQGRHVHGEADLCAALLPAGAKVLDAGCGTGRVAVRLAELGFDCVGTDVDESMLAVAREHAPDLPWFTADLASLRAEDLGGATGFDLVVLAGTVVPLLAEGTVPAAVTAVAALLGPEGLLVAGFGLDRAHLPARCPVTPLGVYDDACAAAGLELVQRLSTWDGDPYDPAAGYAVSVHRAREPRTQP